MEKLKVSTRNLAPFAREDSQKRCKKLTELFNEETLLGYGLERNADTFADIMQGGYECQKLIREAHEKELPVNSKLKAVAEAARTQIDEVISDFKSYVQSFKQVCAAHNTGEFSVMPEYVTFENGEVTLTAEGEDALDNQENLYLTTDEQIEIYKASKQLVDDTEKLQSLVSKYGWNAIGDFMAVVDLRVKDSIIKVETIKNFGTIYKKRF